MSTMATTSTTKEGGVADLQPAAVVNVQPPANYVTRDVFDATVNPMQGDISEIKADVKTLLTRDAGRTAVAGMVGRTATAAATLAAGAVGALVTIIVNHH